MRNSICSLFSQDAILFAMVHCTIFPSAELIAFDGTWLLECSLRQTLLHILAVRESSEFIFWQVIYARAYCALC